MFFSTHIFVVDMLELKCYCQINEAFHVYKCNVKNELEWVRVVKILKKQWRVSGTTFQEVLEKVWKYLIIKFFSTKLKMKRWTLRNNYITSVFHWNVTIWSGHMIIKEMFYIPIKLKPELARASMTTSHVNNQWCSNFKQQII